MLACIVCGIERTYRRRQSKVDNDQICCKGLADLDILDEVVGQGSFGTVHAAFSRTSLSVFAVKITHIKSSHHLAELRAECALMAQLHHPRIVHFFEASVQHSTFYSVMEFLAGGDLFDRLAKRGNYSELNARLAAWQILEAVAYLHEHEVVHRDVKPENILLKSRRDDVNIKLCDFGLARNLPRPDALLDDYCAATPEYAAPEQLARRPYGLPVDCWALGVVLYVLLTGTMPFGASGCCDDDAYARAMNTDFFCRSSATAADLVRSLLDLTPRTRFSARRAQAHAWFADAATKLDDSRVVDGLKRLQRRDADESLRANDCHTSRPLQAWLAQRDLLDVDLNGWCDSLDDLYEFDDSLCAEFLAEAALPIVTAQRFRQAIIDLQPRNGPGNEAKHELSATFDGYPSVGTTGLTGRDDTSIVVASADMPPHSPVVAAGPWSHSALDGASKLPQCSPLLAFRHSDDNQHTRRIPSAGNCRTSRRSLP